MQATKRIPTKEEITVIATAIRKGYLLPRDLETPGIDPEFVEGYYSRSRETGRATIVVSDNSVSVDIGHICETKDLPHDYVDYLLALGSEFDARFYTFGGKLSFSGLDNARMGADIACAIAKTFYSSVTKHLKD